VKIIKAIINTAVLPIAIVKDVITMGGAMIDEEPQTIKTLKEIDQNIFGKTAPGGKETDGE